MRELVEFLPHVNATLNAAAAILLVLGLRFIRQGQELAHRRAMLASYFVSILFLVSYLTYHGSLRELGLSERRFPLTTPTVVRYSYYGMLLSHVVLAAAVPVLTSVTIYFGLRDDRVRHRRWARWTYPIWLYVSVTGVLIYLILYQL